MSAGAREFVSQVLELAVADSARAWLTVAFDADAEVHNATAVAGAYPLVAVCRYGRGYLADGRLTGRWPTVLGAAHADWVLLPAHEATRDGLAAGSWSPAKTRALTVLPASPQRAPST